MVFNEDGNIELCEGKFNDQLNHPEMIGEIINNVQILGELDKSEYEDLDLYDTHNTIMICRCLYCGNLFVRGYNTIRRNKVKSCGCKTPEHVKNNLKKINKKKKKKAKNRRNKKDYKTKEKLRKILIGMKKRCIAATPDSESYKHYKGRGITICDEWLGEDGFDNFYN